MLTSVEERASLLEDSPEPTSTTLEENIFNIARIMVPSELTNFVASPLSASVALNMLLAGTNGTSRWQLQSALGLFHDENQVRNFYKSTLERLDNQIDVQLSVVNAIFHQDSLLSDYMAKIKEIFHAEIRQIDFTNDPFQAARLINQWVSDRTDAKINNLIDKIDCNTEVVLVSTLYFKGAWQFPFTEDNTTTKPFYVSGNSIVDLTDMSCPFNPFREVRPTKIQLPIDLSNSKFVDLPTMSDTFAIMYVENKDLSLKMAALPFKGRQYAMYLILPMKEDVSLSLVELESKLNVKSLNQLIDQMTEKEVILSMPKFKIEKKIDLKETLTNLGARELFSSQADLSRMSTKRLVVNEIIQNVVIDVTESGTEAAAATHVNIALRGGPFLEQRKMDLNRPFMYFLMEQGTRMVLFSGHFVGSN